jgi:hypothetical protein
MTMKMIQPNCRVQFAAEDIDFIVSVLGSRLGNAECLIQLLADEESRDLVLDDEALLRALLERRGCLRVSIGNHSLFLSGVFPERIRFRAEKRGFPDLKYYETLGRSQYKAASDHRLAQRYELSNILHILSERFETTRLALNDISDRLFSLGDSNYALDALLMAKATEDNAGQN